MEIFSPDLVGLITHYGYAILFLLAVIEGPIIAIITGLLVSLGYFNAITGFLILLAGDIVGDAFCYSLGFFGGRRFAHRWGRYLGITEERLDSIEKQFVAHDWKILLFGKGMVTGTPTGIVLLFAAGLFKVPFGRYMWLNILGSTPKIIILQAIGFYFGEGILANSNRIFEYFTGIFLAVALLIMLYLYRARVLLFLQGKNKQDVSS